MTTSLLEQTIYVRGENRPFGELTVEDARNRADELREAVGWGPTVRIAPVAQAWRELSLVMQRSSAETVDQLSAEQVAELAPKLWVVPPGGSLLP
jgi:hypothetical protein